MATSVTSKKSSAKRDALPVPRGRFAPAVLARAKALAGRYGMVVRFDRADGAYAARVIELPLVVGFGNSPQAAAREALALAVTTVAFAIEEGRQPPAPGLDEPRTEQINFRLSVEEKARLEA